MRLAVVATGSIGVSTRADETNDARAGGKPALLVRLPTTESHA
jgi:hypothetical protein